MAGKEKTMNVTLNSLPTKTWNQLKMNETTLTVEGDFANHTPQAQWDAAEVRWLPQAPWADGPAAYGFSTDLSELTAGADAALVETAAGQAMTAPIVLRYTYEAQEHGVSRLVLHAAPDSLLSAVLVFQSPKEGSADVSALQIQIDAEDRAQVRLYVAQLLGQDSLSLHEVSGVCGEDAHVQVVRLDLGSQQAYVGTNLDLKGRSSRFTTNIGYHTRPEQVLDMNYVALHHGPRTESLMEVSGTLEQNGRKVFRGTIDFQQGCPGAKGTESENVLLMGDNMVNQTIPLILCKEEDVEGNHGASIGELDDKVLFYLGARGIAPEAARKMIAHSRIEAVCNRIPSEEVRRLVREFEEVEEASNDEDLQS